MKPLRLIVLGNAACEPYPGVAWQVAHYVVGLSRLGHDVHYFETSSSWPYDPQRQSRVNDSNYAVSYLSGLAERFGFGDRWAYRRSYSDKAWFGMEKSKAEELLAHADAVLSITGSTRLAEEGLKVGRLVYVGTDPVIHEVLYEQNQPDIRSLVDEHHDVVTFGENIGTPHCPLPPLPRLRARTRQPVVCDFWDNPVPPTRGFTTIGNWKQTGRDSEFRGENYGWSKDREYRKFIGLPLRTEEQIELATTISQLGPEDQILLTENGWRLEDSISLSGSSYRDYVAGSRGEFTVAKDANVRLHTGWFSDRSACYLAAGRPVITQDTGFGTVLPLGEGLFAFQTEEDILTAFDAIRSDYGRHCRAAQQIAQESFRAETVLAKLLTDLGF
jgi:hypothetical protein